MLEYLFYPQSVCLIGNMDINENISSPENFDNIKNNLSAFKGGVFFVDLKKGRYFPQADLYVVLLNEHDLLENVDKFSCKFCVILPGNYSQKKLIISKFKERGIRFLGPNSVCGIINTDNGLNLTFEKNIFPKRGNHSIVSQSGGVGAALLDIASQNSSIGGIGKLIWLGNAWDIGFSDIIHFLNSDRQTRSIGLYIEGLQNGKDFTYIVRKINKPIVALKSGIYQQSAKRALTHTSSIAGESRIYSSAFKQLGIKEVDDIDELYYTSYFLSLNNDVRGKRVAIISNVGGPSILAADILLDSKLELAELENKTVERIKKKYPMISVLNPLDIIADADGSRFEYCLTSVVNDRNVDAVLLINMLKSCTLKLEDVKIISDFIRKSQKLVIDVSPGIGDWKKIRSVMKENDIYVFNNLHQAVKIIKSMHDYYIYKNRK